MKPFNKIQAEINLRKLKEKESEHQKLDCLFMWVKQNHITKTEFIWLTERIINY